MSTIPVVNQLGDELERAARRSSARLRSRRRRRLGMLAVAGALVASGTALATGLISGGAEQQATASIACYDGADPDFSGSVAVVPREAGTAGPSPVQLCRRELALGRRAAAALVACAHKAGVAVIPGRRASDCRHAGFTPLDPAYEPARRRAARLERAVLGVEASADCIAPGQLARRVRALLQRSGWREWTVTVDPARGDGPCGSVSYSEATVAATSSSTRPSAGSRCHVPDRGGSRTSSTRSGARCCSGSSGSPAPPASRWAGCSGGSRTSSEHTA